MITRIVVFFALFLQETAFGFAPSFLFRDPTLSVSQRRTAAFSTVARYRPHQAFDIATTDAINELTYLEDTTLLRTNNLNGYVDPTESLKKSKKQQRKYFSDPSMIEFAPSKDYLNDESASATDASASQLLSAGNYYPYALMMHACAPYISAHAGETAVFHIPGEILQDEKSSNALFSDMALAWTLGMKLVVVVGCRSKTDGCDFDFDDPHSCHNTLTVTDAKTLRRCEEEAGFLRTEVERKLNRYLRVHGGCVSSEDALEGNVVSGNFYTAQQFGRIQGQDFQYTGYTSGVHVKNIKNVLDNNDVVLLTTVGVSDYGDVVNVNGYHLAANVAAALNAYKVIYMSNEGTVLQKKGEHANIQELPMSFAKEITDFYDVHVHNTGFATFDSAQENLDPGAVELLLHLGWGTWALENGVTRAHIVNPSDGAILEELFTSKNGANTCLYHDIEDEEPVDDALEEDWDSFFASASKTGKGTHTSFR